MKRLSLIIILISTCIFQKSFAQKYVTNNPYVQSTNVSWCNIARVEIYEDKTKILVQIPSQKKGRPWVSFSEWTVMMESEVGKNIESKGLFDKEISMPELNSTIVSNQVLYNVYKQAVERVKKSQEFILSTYGYRNSWGDGGSLIKNLGNDELNTKYSIKSKEPKKYSFWLTFPKIPEGIESISIYEFGENGFRWRGIKIKNPDQTPRITENEIKNNWKSNGHDLVEGIYERLGGDPKYKLAVVKVDKDVRQSEEDAYRLIYLSGGGRIWKEGNVKGNLLKTATPNLYKTQWYMSDKSLSNDPIISFERGKMKVLWANDGEENFYIKLYPYSRDDNDFNSTITSSGTGFAISSSGYIATNYHVIDGLSDISIKGISNDFTKSFTAKVIASDKNNDLAILKIDDYKFNGTLGKLPYSIKYSSPKTGQNVFTLGYPLRNSMGDEVKVTDGIISSKTGYDGDITSYQVSVPVQSGNSGGPLFDKDGNLVGVINAKHTQAENASYAIKVSYLISLIESLDDETLLPKYSTLKGQNLENQIEELRKYIYIIEGK